MKNPVKSAVNGVCGFTCVAGEYDPLGRLIEERIEAPELVTRHKYAYDAHGNRSHILEGDSLTQIECDSQHRPIRVKDPLGNITVTEYET